MPDRQTVTQPSPPIKPTVLMIGNYLPLRLGNKNVWHFMAERLSLEGWNIITTSSKANKVLRLIDMLTTILRRRREYFLAQIDVFSGQAFIFAYLSSWLLMLIGKPFILTLHGGGLPEFFSKHPRPVQKLLNKATEVVTPSPYLQEVFRSVRSDIRLIPNPIDLSSAMFRLRHEITVNLIWVRAFHSVYNPQIAIRVLKVLVDHGRGAQLIMLGPEKGDGSLNDTLLLAKALNVDKFVQVVGGVPHEQIPEWLDRADVFINTTNYDNAPRSVLEAMASGLCVVSTKVGGIPYLVNDGVDALLVPPNDPYAMAAAVERILTEPGLAEKLSANARKKAEQFDWSAILPRWEKLFSEVIEKEID